jgi:hypothetical protein
VKNLPEVEKAGDIDEDDIPLKGLKKKVKCPSDSEDDMPIRLLKKTVVIMLVNFFSKFVKCY